MHTARHAPVSCAVPNDPRQGRPCATREGPPRRTALHSPHPLVTRHARVTAHRRSRRHLVLLLPTLEVLLHLQPRYPLHQPLGGGRPLEVVIEVLAHAD